SKRTPERRRGSDLQGRQAEEHLSGGTAEESAWHRDIHIDSRKNRAEVELATLTWVDWYNNRRLLERLGHTPPAEAEKAYYAS
ncbi:hypothetical protein ACSLNR_28220, partial [Escherichia coli]